MLQRWHCEVCLLMPPAARTPLQNASKCSRDADLSPKNYAAEINSLEVLHMEQVDGKGEREEVKEEGMEQMKVWRNR